MDAIALLDEYDIARAHTAARHVDLTDAEARWRPHDDASGIGWHLGHQAAVNHYLVRNLTAAEPTLDATFDHLFDSATPEPDRGDLPPLDAIVAYREAVADRTHHVARRILGGEVGAPAQLRGILAGVLTAVVNHEYQHDCWIDEVRAVIGKPPAPAPRSRRLVEVEGYWVLAGPAFAPRPREG